MAATAAAAAVQDATRLEPLVGFFLSFVLFFYYTNIYFSLRRSAATTEKGSNDASGVVWALGE
jgi:hypothetical protein